MFSHKGALPSGRILASMISHGKAFFYPSVSTFMIASQRFHCLCGAISEAFSAIESSNAGANLVGSTFNIQNSIPHKSQKTKVVSETNRVKEL